MGNLEKLDNKWLKAGWAFVIIILVVIVYFMIKDGSEYIEVESVAERIGSNYIVLHEAVGPNERIGLSHSDVVSSRYNDNEGWLLRNKTIYCSNRLIDDINKISNHSGISRYAANPDGTRMFMDLERFKSHLVSLDEICIEEGEFKGEEALKPTLFIEPEKKIWRKNN